MPGPWEALRGALKEAMIPGLLLCAEEWILILLGGILGAIVGIMQAPGALSSPPFMAFGFCPSPGLLPLRLSSKPSFSSVTEML